jgi:hypothetical protein
MHSRNVFRSFSARNPRGKPAEFPVSAAPIRARKRKFIPPAEGSVSVGQLLCHPATGWAIDRLVVKPTRPHTLKEYADCFKRLREIEGAVQVWIGDVANAGKEEHGYGAMSEIAETIGIPEGTLWKQAYVARQTSWTRIQVYNDYKHHLTYNHFLVVAPLEPEEQVRWLEVAGAEKLSTAELRSRIKGDEWEPRYFNIWSAMPIESWQNGYPGQIPGGILLNILYYTTEIDDLVIDPFGGGGNMALACKRMKRRCITYDIAPQFPGIKKHDATKPFPNRGAQLVFLDPPYWKQKRGEYSVDEADLSNIEDVREFHDRLKIVCDNAKAALVPGGYLALIIGASQTKDYSIDHDHEMYARLRTDSSWTHVTNIAAAYPTTQYSGNDVNNAKEHRYLLNLYTAVGLWRFKP